MKKKKSKKVNGPQGLNQMNYSSDSGAFPSIVRANERLAPLPSQKVGKKKDRESSASSRTGTGSRDQGSITLGAPSTI